MASADEILFGRGLAEEAVNFIGVLPLWRYVVLWVCVLEFALEDATVIAGKSRTPRCIDGQRSSFS